MQFDDVLRNADILPYQVYKGCLRMDGQTLVNLEVFSNSADGGSSGQCVHSLISHEIIIILKSMVLIFKSFKLNIESLFSS